MKGWALILIGLPLLIIPPLGIIFIILGIWALAFPAPKSSPDAGFLAQSAGFHYVHSYDNTGIAYDPDSRRVKLMSTFNKKKIVCEYDLSEIRSFSSQKQTGGHVAGTGAQVAGANIRNAYENRMASGIFIDVKDVNYPKWRIAFDQRDEISQNRWSEILNQAFEAT